MNKHSFFLEKCANTMEFLQKFCPIQFSWYYFLRRRYLHSLRVLRFLFSSEHWFRIGFFPSPFLHLYIRGQIYGSFTQAFQNGNCLVLKRKFSSRSFNSFSEILINRFSWFLRASENCAYLEWVSGMKRDCKFFTPLMKQLFYSSDEKSRIRVITE